MEKQGRKPRKAEIMDKHEEKQQALKEVAIAFAEFLDEDCIRSFTGWTLRDGLGEYDKTEFEIEELYDYWREKIIAEETKNQTNGK